MLNPFKLEEYKKHKWFACDMDDGIIASGDTLKEVLNKFGRSRASFVRSKEYEFNEDTSHSRTTISVYGTIELLEANGYDLDADHNTWHLNLNNEAIVGQTLGGITLVFDKANGDKLLFEYPQSVSKMKENELYISQKATIVKNELIPQLVDFLEQGKILCKILDNEYNSHFDEKVFITFKDKLEPYMTMFSTLYKSPILDELSDYKELYSLLLIKNAYNVCASITKAYTEIKLVENKDGSDSYEAQFIPEIDYTNKGFLLEVMTLINKRDKVFQTASKRVELYSLEPLLAFYIEFKNSMRLYKWAEDRLPNSTDYLKSTYNIVSVNADYLHQSYSYLDLAYNRGVYGSLIDNVFGLVLLDFVYSYLRKEI